MTDYKINFCESTNNVMENREPQLLRRKISNLARWGGGENVYMEDGVRTIQNNVVKGKCMTSTNWTLGIEDGNVAVDLNLN